MDILKLKATTLVETLVAMILVTISILLVWQVFLFADIGNSTVLKTKSEILANNIHSQTCINQDFQNKTIDTKNFIIEFNYTTLHESSYFYSEEIVFLHRVTNKTLFTYNYYLRKRQ